GSERAREQCQPALAVGKREKAPARQRLYPQPPQNRGNAPAVRLAGGVEQNVGPVDTGCHHLFDGVVPAVARVFVLTLRPDVSDLVLYLLWGAPHLTFPAIVTHLAADGRGPHRAGNQLQQLGFAGAVRTGQHPSLAGTDGPTHILEHPPRVPIEAHTVQSHLDVTGIWI